MVNHKAVERIMKLSGIKAKTKRKYKQTTSSVHSLEVAENLLGRDFTFPLSSTESGLVM